MNKMSEEINVKDYQKLKEQVNKLDQKFNEQIKKISQKVSEQVNNSEKKILDQIKNMDQTQQSTVNSIEKKLSEQLNKLEQRMKEHGSTTTKKIEDLANMFEAELKEKHSTLDKKLEENLKTLESEVGEKFKIIETTLNNHIANLENEIGSIKENIKGISKDFSSKLNGFKEEFDTKEEVLGDMIKKFNEENMEYQNSLKPILEDLKSEQDLVKITVDVLKKQIYESAKEWIDEEIKLACKNKEKEILMNLWIDEMKNIIDSLDSLKKLHPKELKLHINEISSTIDSFKAKFIK